MAPEPDATTFDALVSLAEHALASRAGMVVLGLSGAQGSGKSTLAAALRRRMVEQGIATVALSLDDLYYTRTERLRLAELVHPLLATRGVPGTHDAKLGLATLDALARGKAVRLPRFDKARDDRCPDTECDMAPSGTRLVLFEGWCLGARPQPSGKLAAPINSLEADEDDQAIWRNHINAALAHDYAALWARIDAMAMLRAPDFAAVTGWRQQQEHALRATAGAAPGVMSDDAVARFVAHYERVTRQLLVDLPGRSDLVIELDEVRRATRIDARYCAAASSTPG